MNEEVFVARDHRYVVLSKDSVRVFAEAVGYADLPDDVTGMLAEDASYRLRDIIQKSCEAMRIAKRRRLCTDDINDALRNADVLPIFGHGSLATTGFQYARSGMFHCSDDPEVDLATIALSSELKTPSAPMTIRASWLAIEGVLKGSPHGHLATGVVRGGVRQPQTVSDDLLLYYDIVTKAILGTDDETMKLALVDLRTNPMIAPLLPYLVNFVSNGVRTVSHDTSQLTKLLHTIESLVCNQSLYLRPKPYLSLLVQSVLYCLLEPLTASINPFSDHWVLRDYAARLLAVIIRRWDGPMTHLKEHNLRTLSDVIADRAKPLCSHYGAIMGLLALGVQAVRHVLLPLIPDYCRRLEDLMKDTLYANAVIKSDAQKVYGALLLSADCLLCAIVQPTTLPDTNTQPSSTCFDSTPTDHHVTPPDVTENIDNRPGTHLSEISQIACNKVDGVDAFQLYTSLQYYFGDALSDRLSAVRRVAEKRGSVSNVSVGGTQSLVNGQAMDEQLTKTPVQNGTKDPIVRLEDENDMTGEEMLQQILNAVVEDAKMIGRADGHRSDAAGDVASLTSSVKSSSSDVIEDEADLSVKATVSDPSHGIKLTILKRPKPAPTVKKSLSKTSQKKKMRRRVDRISDAFELSYVAERRVPAEFVLRLQGHVQRCPFGTAKQRERALQRQAVDDLDLSISSVASAAATAALCDRIRRRCKKTMNRAGRRKAVCSAALDIIV